MPTVAEVFARARRLEGDERRRYLDEACAGDSDLRAEVESLLTHVDSPHVDTHLDDEPVEARPPSAAYRLRKFVRRHRAGVVVGSVIGLALLGLVAALSWQTLRLSRRSADLAQQRDAARVERTTAHHELAEALTNLAVLMGDMGDLRAAQPLHCPVPGLQVDT